MWWLDQESNQGHKDFQSFALPTELSSLFLTSQLALLIGYLIKIKQ
jgi:hypothetical protein